MIIQLLLSVSAVFVVYKALQHYYSCWRAPPGPWGLPFVGIFLRDALTMATSSNSQPENKLFFRLKDKQGEEMQRQPGAVGVWSANWGMQRIVFLHTYDAAREALVDNAETFSGRPQTHFYQKFFSQGHKGVIFSEGEEWKLQRRFALKTLRNLGFGKSQLDRDVQLEADELLQYLTPKAGQAVNTMEPLSWAVSNVISKLLFGERWDYADPKFHTHLENIRVTTHLDGFLPFLGWMYPTLDEWGLLQIFRSDEKMLKADGALLSMILEKVKEIQQRTGGTKPSYNEPPKNFIETYLRECSDGDEGPFSLLGLSQICRDLFVAGSDTTTNSLSWALLYLSQHPLVQTKLQAEIDRHMEELGEVNLNMEWKSTMHYTCAVIDEVQRLATIAPLAVDKRVLHTVTFRGYRITPDEVIFTNLYGIHHDPRIWGEDCNLFKPERFLNEEGQYQSSKYLNPFGMGRRLCLGENLARMELFLFLVKLIRRFTVRLAPVWEAQLPTILLGEDGVVHSPGKHEIILEERSH